MRVYDIFNCAILFVFVCISVYIYASTSLKIGVFTFLVYYLAWEMMMRKPQAFIPIDEEDQR